MGQYFHEIHASAASQLGGAELHIQDSDQVAQLRGASGYDELIALGDALCFQLRYREAVEVFSKAITLRPDDMTAYRRRAARYITTLRPDLALSDFLRCGEMGGDRQDITYRAGLCRYYMGQYSRAMEDFLQCYPLCDEEMGVAVIFWHTLSAWRCGEEPKLFNEHYRAGMQVGHHTAYDFVLNILLTGSDAAGALNTAPGREDDLEFSIMAYGIAEIEAQRGNREAAAGIISQLLSRDGFWISYAYIAAWNDRNNNSEDTNGIYT